jgi:hypothetical protein
MHTYTSTPTKDARTSTHHAFKLKQARLQALNEVGIALAAWITRVVLVSLARKSNVRVFELWCG